MVELTLFSPEKFLGFMALGFGTGLYGTLIGAGGGVCADAYLASPIS